MHISIAPERLTSIFGLDITNTVFTAVVVVAIIFLMAFLFFRNISYTNPGKIQLIFELGLGYLYNMVSGLMGETKAKKVLAFLFTFLIFILVSNWFGLLPFVPATVIDKPHTSSETTEITHAEPELSVAKCIEQKDCYLTISGVKQFEEPIHIFRAPTTDLSMTVSFAILSVIAINYMGFSTLKLGYIKKFINFSNPVNFIVGILELLSEFIRIISFSFRLFGNIFAGELLLTVITFLTLGLATLPFLFLEIFVGFIQALVFFILTAMFMSLAVEKHHN